MNDKLKKFITGILSLRILALFIAAFYPFSGPHEWRQYDTIGMAYRYYIEFFESLVDKYPKLIPAVLQAGDHFGITPVELPILNLIVSPFFLLGENTGITLANIFLLIINIQLTYQCYLLWKEETILEEKVSESFLLIPLISFSLSYFAKFMPDMLSVLLVLYALGLALFKNRIAIAIFLASLALLMKPTSVIVFAIFLLMRQRKEIKHYLWMAIPILVTLVYYKAVNPAILEYSGRESIFSVTTKPLGLAIQQIFEKPALFFTIFLKKSFGRWLIIPFLALLIFNIKTNKTSLTRIGSIFGIILLQALFLHLLSGDHPYWHNYYYLGITPILSLFLLPEIQKSSGLIKNIFKVTLLTTVILQVVYDLKPALKPHKKREWQLREECLSLKKQTPSFPWNQGYHFQSTKESFPILGVCFGEIQGAGKTKFGFFYKDKGLPSSCQLVQQTKHLVLGQCD